MRAKGVVFVTGDRLGNRVSELLEEAGCQVIRGSRPNLASLTEPPGS